MRVSLLFPGQGAQFVGMGASLVQRSPIAADLFSRASDILGFDLLNLCTEGPLEQLSRTEFSQPALFVHSFAALKQLESERPDLWDSVQSVAGLSLGEYTAVASTGAICFEDGVRLVQLRGKAMQSAADAVKSGMSSVLGLELDKLQMACEAASTPDSFVRVANFLCPGNIAISGHLDALERADTLCAEAGAMKSVRLQVAGAFHTPIMQSAVGALNAGLAGIQFEKPVVPVYSNVDAAPHTAAAEIRSLLAQQVVSPVQWEASMRAMIESGTEKFIEIGAGRVLAGTLKRINRTFPCENLGE